MSGGRKHTAEIRARISRGVNRANEVRRIRHRVEPRDLTRLQQSGTVPERIAPFLEGAAVEAAELIQALGGPDAVSPQRRALIEDCARIGLVLRATLARYVQGDGADAELGSKVGTLAAARRANLQALGLDRVAKDVPSLRSYVASKSASNAQETTNEAR
jgi:hypothetical protein